MIRLVTYFLFAYLFSWIIELPLVLNTQLGWSVPVLPMQHYMSSFGPLMAALCTTFIFGGFSGVKKFFAVRYHPRVSLKWYFFALGSPVLFFLISFLIQYLISGEGVAWNEIGTTNELPGVGGLGVWLFWILTFGLGEESGWRGFALPELQRKYTPLYSAFLLSIFWAFWHLPFFFEHPNFMEMNAFMMMGWFVSLIFGSFLMAWIFNASGQNVMIPALWHGTYNTVVTGNSAVGLVPSILTAFVIIFTVMVALPGLRKMGQT